MFVTARFLRSAALLGTAIFLVGASYADEPPLPEDPPVETGESPLLPSIEEPSVPDPYWPDGFTEESWSDFVDDLIDQYSDEFMWGGCSGFEDYVENVIQDYFEEEPAPDEGDQNWPLSGEPPPPNLGEGDQDWPVSGEPTTPPDGGEGD